MTMTNLKLLREAKENAPSYLELTDDGADFRCEECEEYGREGFVVTFTPDGVNHYATHLSCLDEEWLKNAKNMGKL